MKLEDFKLSQELIGHSLDVRSVANGTNNGTNFIISGSRDKTTKIWSADTENHEYSEKLTLQDHKNFISCVYYYEEENWICTASNDATICCYRLGETSPFTRLEGHTSTVCSLTRGLPQKSLISGSWDQTARIWTQVDGIRSSTTLEGHEAAVWAVTTVGTDKYATGSADKNVFIWNGKGEKVIVLKGHTDCVRGLLVLNNMLLSCSNDASIRVWSCDSWELIKELHGHSNYIYTIAANKALGDDVFLTGSEDSTIRMWSVSGGALGVLEVPAQSVWSITCLNNSDIVTGTSDALIRIFTASPDREVHASIKGAFDLAVETRKLESSKKLGGIAVKELPGPESLLQPGKEGATKIVRQPDGKILCYQWTNNQWNCLGDVTGASGGSDESSGKKLFEGKEYDFVFSVDIKDDAPPIKLPYNRNDDPFVAAQKFIEKNELPQAYLDQIADFIIKNAGAVAPPVISSGTYVDPFTGGGRYIPGGGSVASVAGANSDPFTGGSSYTTQQPNNAVNFQPRSNAPALDPFTGANSYTTFSKPASGLHFPHRLYTTVDNFDATKVLDKLRDFNSKTGDSSSKVSNETLEGIVKLAANEYDPKRVEALKQVLTTWSKDILFPVLDITRLLVRDEKICSELVANNDVYLLNLLENVKFSKSIANQIMAIRCLNNKLVHDFGRRLILSKLNEILSTIITHIQKGGANLQSAIATFHLNLTVMLFEFASNENVIANNQIIAEALLYFITWVNDLESTYRAYQALGNLISLPNNEIVIVQIKSVDVVVEKIRSQANNSELVSNGFEKLSLCASDLFNIIQK